MSNDNETQPDDQASEQLITVQPTALTNYPPVSEWAGTNNMEAAGAAPGGQSLFHALRRHWLLSVLIGSACAVFAGLLIFLLTKPVYTATAGLRIGQKQEIVMPGNSPDGEATASYDIFKDTQGKLVKSRFVIAAALRNLGPVMNSLPTLKQEDQMHNAMNFLTDKVSVYNDKKNETIDVSMTSVDQKEGAQIVNALVKAYFDEVVNVERLQKQQRYSQLLQFSADNENLLRSKRTELRQLADNLGGSENTTMSIAVQLEQQMIFQLQAELTHLVLEQANTKRRMEQLVSLQSQLSDQDVSDSELNGYLQQNSTEYRDLQNKKIALENWKRTAFKNLLNVDESKLPLSMRRFLDELKVTADQIEALKANAKERVVGERRIQIQREIRQLQSDSQGLTMMVSTLRDDLKQKTEKVFDKTRSSIDVQMKQAEIANLEHWLQNVNAEKDRLHVELKAPSRISVVGDPNNPADAPETEDGKLKRYFIAVLGSLVAFVLPAGALVAWDMRIGKINAVSDVQQKLGVTVLGSVPMIPARVIRRLGASTKRNQVWKVRLTESVDGVAARLLRKAEQEQAKLILISSAMPGEGKTTLSTQLAMSLARNMRRTVLVDFDLRRPALDGVFGVALGPGICEALRGQGDVLEMVQATETENLSLVTAGRWDRQVLAALGNGSVGAVLAQLRENFDFVIIDSSPILPIVDTRLVSQYVDGVVLSVFRDVSQGDKVLAAQEILEAFGVRSVEAVVTGGGHHGYGGGMDYESAPLDGEDENYPSEGEPQSV